MKQLAGVLYTRVKYSCVKNGDSSRQQCAAQSMKSSGENRSRKRGWMPVAPQLSQITRPRPSQLAQTFSVAFTGNLASTSAYGTTSSGPSSQSCEFHARDLVGFERGAVATVVCGGDGAHLDGDLACGLFVSHLRAHAGHQVSELVHARAAANRAVDNHLPGAHDARLHVLPFLVLLSRMLRERDQTDAAANADEQCRPADDGVHGVIHPDARAMGESLRWEACGLIVWTEGGRVMRRVMLPSGAPSRAAAAEGARVTAPPTLNWLLPNVMASCAISSDSVTLPAACTPHDSQISHPALALLVGRSGDRPSRRRSGGMGHKRTR